MNKFARSIVAVSVSMALLAGCNHSDDTSDNGSKSGFEFVDARLAAVEWPAIDSVIAQDPAIEARIVEILAKMSLEEKVGQMIQPEIGNVTPDEVKEYHLGSVLNGGGSFPGGDKNATAADWVALADAYYDVSMDDSDGKVAVPIIWGTDAVHGHNNVIGATLFPHNIGLGATHNPELIKQIGAVTAKEVTVTGIDWAFAPTLAVVRDDRWGRTYEGYSEDPEIVKAFAGQMIEGLQGVGGSDELFNDSHVVATAKHFMGDGGTDKGDDQGNNLSTAQQMHDIHLQGYLSALAAGAQTVMASFNSWQGEKMHGNKDMLTGILKEEMGFDGFVIGDWNGHGQVEGCTDDNCAQAINAGVDMIMVPYSPDWKNLIANTIDQVHSGEISEARIDDAVSRILRVKLRAGLWDHRPSERANANHTELLSADAHRAIARQAVRESLVLLKNNNDILPLDKGARILVAGDGADNIGKQNGGWTVSWQGTGNSNADFPSGTSIYQGIKEAVTEGSVTLSEDGSAADANLHDVAIVVFGEDPYAEGLGDIETYETLEYQADTKSDLELLEKLKAKGIPVVSVFLSGRPLWVNKEINASDAFVAAWLPGSEGGGIADVLFGDYDFTGKLSYSWPQEVCQTNLNRNDEDYDPLFAYGYGLTYASDVSVDILSEDTTGYEQGCDPVDLGNVEGTSVPLNILVGSPNAPWSLFIGDSDNWAAKVEGKTGTSDDGVNIVVTSEDKDIQEDARKIVFSGAKAGQVYLQSSESYDELAYLVSDATLSFDIRVDAQPTDAMNVRIDCGYPCTGELDVTDLINAQPVGEWSHVAIDLQCFANRGTDFSKINSPLVLTTSGAATLSLANIAWQPNTVSDADITCSEDEEIVIEPGTPVTEELVVYQDGLADNSLLQEPGVWSEQGNLITLDPALVDGANTVVDVQFAAAAEENGVVFFKSTEEVDISTLSAVQFDIRVLDYGTNTSGFVAKLVCQGGTCSTGDIAIDTTLNEWVTVTIPLDDPNYPETFLSANVTSILEVFPAWGDQGGSIHYQINNLKVVE